MRVIRRKTLEQYWKKYADAEQPLKSWFAEAVKAKWKNSNDMKNDYPKASVITGKRTVFNIKGNHYRLVVDIEYKINTIFIVWFGPHAEYDKLNLKFITYDKGN